MKPKYNKSNIIILALIYNYICNQSKEMSKYDVENFFNSINYELYYNQFFAEIPEEETSDIYEYDKKTNKIRFTTPQCLPYCLSSIKRYYIDQLPNEIIETSLLPEILMNLNLEREQIDTKKIIDPVWETKEISALKYNDAITSVIKILENKGCSNIKVGPAFPCMIEGDKGYSVKCSYSIERTIIDVEPTIEEYQKRLEIY